MIGHEVELSETNARDWVALCTCGWIGPVYPTPRYRSKNKNRLKFNVEIGKAGALDTHVLHLHEVRADIERDSDAELVRIGRLIPLANASLQRRGRFGHA